MRQVRMRKAVSAAALVIGVSVLTVACGQVQAGSSASASSPAPTRAAVCASPATPVSAQHPLAINEDANGKSLCVKRGDGVFVTLHGTAVHKWTAIQSSSDALVPRANGRLMLALGVTGGYFVAVHSGTAVLTSSRTPCVRPSGSTPSGGPKCSAPQSVFRVTLVITG